MAARTIAIAQGGIKALFLCRSKEPKRPKDKLAGTVWVGKGSKFGRPVETKLVFTDGQKFEWSTDGQVWSSGKWTEKEGYHFIDTGKSGIWRAKVSGDRMLVELTRADGGVSSGGYEFSKQK